MGKLDGKVAIVTGGSSGIGLASARAFVAEDARVIITGRRQSRIDATLKEFGEGATGVQGDVSDMAVLDRLTAEAERRAGRIDIFFANAGLNALAPFDAVAEEAFERLFLTNVKGLAQL